MLLFKNDIYVDYLKNVFSLIFYNLGCVRTPEKLFFYGIVYQKNFFLYGIVHQKKIVLTAHVNQKQILDYVSLNHV